MILDCLLISLVFSCVFSNVGTKSHRQTITDVIQASSFTDINVAVGSLGSGQISLHPQFITLLLNKDTPHYGYLKIFLATLNLDF